MKINVSCLLAAAALVSMSACKEQSAPMEYAAPATAVSISFDSWLGQWNGPEGTFLSLRKVDDEYEVTIQSLDGPSKYLGRAAQDRIEFARNGTTESIRASNGEATGMKWLADKENCLTIKAGEGFCRD